MNSDILNLTKLGKNVESEEIPEPGTPENPWIGVERVVNGQKQFYALSGSERRRSIRAARRAEEAEQRKGQRRYNRQQRKQEFDTQTVRMQMKILTGEIQASFDMQDNLARHAMRQTRLNERETTEPDRKAKKALGRLERLQDRRRARVVAGTARHADLVAAGLR